MAARLDYHVSNTNSPLLNRTKNEDEGTEKRLPSGRCNFTNLNVGGNAPICGCRRFWIQSTTSIDRGEVCMCEHHACYHDHGSEPDITIIGSPGLTVTPQILERVSRNDTPEKHTQVGRSTDDVPDTLQWAQYVRSGSNLGLPAIPSQCLLPSDTASVISGSQASYLRPFGGRGLSTLNNMPRTGTRPNLPPPTVHDESNGDSYVQSLTEVFTPSVRASQNDMVAAEFSKNVTSVQFALEKMVKKDASIQGTQPVNMEGSVNTTQSVSSGLTTLRKGSDEETLLPRIRHIINHLIDVPEKLRNHDDRLDHLENSNDADEYLETRVGELEERIVEVEKQQIFMTDASGASGRNVIDGSFSSRTSSTMISLALDRIDPSRLEALEAQVAELQASALPSYTRPWEVEVVFLPFGHKLKGVWSSQHGINHSPWLANGIDDWTQTQPQPITADYAGLDQTSALERSATILATDNETWMMARACGTRSRVDERLRSRGLVKLVRIFGPDARDVQAAITTAFGNLPDTLAADLYSQRDDENAGTIPKTLKRYFGLSAPWIPLRKIHKDSTLRFLNASEMLTPALWTVSFLSSSVAMRHSSTRRLYVTHRDSYIQHLGRQNSDWTWAKLRQLPRTYPDQVSAEIPEADAAEPCWEFDDRLDPAHESVHSTFTSSISQLSITSSQHAHDDVVPRSPSDHFSSAPISPHTSTTPTSLVPISRDFRSSPIKERKPSRPAHVRTNSMPTLVPTKFSQPKRRITSFEPEYDSQPSSTKLFVSDGGLRIDVKRRRTRSPSRPRDHTPRYSNGPPSPYTNTTNVGYDEVCAGSRGKEQERGNTPFAYATPYSIAPYNEAGPRSAVDIYEDLDYKTGNGDGKGSGTDDALLDDDGRDPEENAFSIFEEDETHDNVHGIAISSARDDEWSGLKDPDETLPYPPIFDTAGTSFYQEKQEEEDDISEVSESPSEYPSKRPLHVDGSALKKDKRLRGDEKMEFKIHVDDAGEDDSL